MPTKPTLPSGWMEKESKSRPGKIFYVNRSTGEKTWKLEDIPKKSSKSKSSKNPNPKRTAESRSSSIDLEGPIQVRALHILAKHRNSRKPSSWRQDPIVIPKDAAIEKMRAIRKQILQAAVDADFTESREKIILAKFSEIAKKESDCSSAKRGGDLGMFGRGKMQRAFEAAAFKLKVNELSDLVESDSGIHIILRIK